MEKNIEEFDEEIEEDSGFQFIDLIIILLKYKKLIISITLPVAIIAFIATFNTISFYRAETSIFVPREQNFSSAQQIINQLGLSGVNRSRRSTFSNQNLLVEIIRSRTFVNQLIDRLKLRKAYEAESPDETRASFLKQVTITPDFTKPKLYMPNQRNSPLMRISVWDQDPQKTAEIANTIVEELVIYIQHVEMSKVSRKRLFVENQLKKASDALIQAEEDIKKFQEKTGTLSLGSQPNIVIDKFAPALQLEYKRLYREYVFRDTLYIALIKQFEAIKLEEAKDTTIIHIIDKAVPPEKAMTTRVFGRRKALGVTIFFFILACLLALAINSHKQAVISKEYSEKIKTIMRYFSFKKINE